MKLVESPPCSDYEATLRCELEQAASNAGAVLRCAGAALSSVVSCTIYVKTIIEPDERLRQAYRVEGLFDRVEGWFRSFVQASIANVQDDNTDDDDDDDVSYECVVK